MSPSFGDLGAAYELAVAADLIKRGFDVFRNLSPNGPADLLVIKSKKILRVQVKGTYAGRYVFAQSGCDIFAAHSGGSLTYYVKEGNGIELLLRGAMVYLVREKKPLQLVDWCPIGLVEPTSVIPARAA
ncbi:MAG TPA: hypothetical protein VIH46_08005 [Candidatus Acidoferrales bacterium]